MKWDQYRDKILLDIDNEAYYLSVLKNVQVHGSYEIKASCPFTELHQSGKDENPSFTVNLSKGTYVCQTCKSKGNVHTFHMLTNKMNKTEAWHDLGDSLGLERPVDAESRPLIDPIVAVNFHNELITSTGPIRQILKERRGLTDDTIRRFQLGWDGDRLTIPVYDENNNVVNIRLYKWNSDDDQFKVINYMDEKANSFGELRIFGIDNVVDDDLDYVVWSEGELDRICAEQYGFPAACPTSGAGSWAPKWAPLFRHKKRIYLCQDNDEAGEIATKKLSAIMSKILEVHIVKWPANFPKKGDITDYFTKYHGTKEGFQKLLDEAPIFGKTEDIEENDDDLPVVNLSEAVNAKWHGKKIKIPVMVAGKSQSSFMAPKKIRLTCANADPEAKRCMGCSLCTAGGMLEVEYAPTDRDLLKLFGCNDKAKETAIKATEHVNSQCMDCAIEDIETYKVDEVRLIPKADSNFGFNSENKYAVTPGYYITEDNVIEANKRYMLTAYTYNDPTTQKIIHEFSNAVPEHDAAKDFVVTPEIIEALKIFQPTEGQSVDSKFDEIHSDLEYNVTRVWERKDVSIAVDLIYHTVLSFNFQKQLIKKGWGELLIIGDSGQAKTTVVEKLMQHYRLGEMLSGESSTRTGLVYSMQQTGNNWMLLWGAYPLNDGGLITIDELSGLEPEVLAKMSDVRSSGIAKATGVVTAETSARTRAIFISNPRNGKQLKTEPYGVQSVLKLFGKTEDVRRLDMAIAVASGEVSTDLLNRFEDDINEVSHKYTSDLCNMRALWAWSRQPEQAVFTEEATKAILKCATDMGKKYSSIVPIVEPADQRLKIARLSIACAACMFSTDTGEEIVVKAEHVEFVVKYMDKQYCKKTFGYDKLSQQEFENSDNSEAALQQLREKFIMVPIADHNEIIQALDMIPYLNNATLRDYTGLPMEDLGALIKFLLTNCILERYKNMYRRRPLGTDFIRTLIDKPIVKAEVDEIRKKYYAGVDY